MLFHAHPRDDQDNEDKQAHPSVRPRKLSSHCIFCSPGSFDSIHTLPDNYNRFAGLPQAPHREYSIEKSENSRNLLSTISLTLKMAYGRR